MSLISKNLRKRLKKLAGIKKEIFKPLLKKGQYLDPKKSKSLLSEQYNPSYATNDWVDGSYGTWWNNSSIEGGIPYTFQAGYPAGGDPQDGCYPTFETPYAGSGNSQTGPAGASAEACLNNPGGECCSAKTFCSTCVNAHDVINFALANNIDDVGEVIVEVQGSADSGYVQDNHCISPNGNYYMYYNAVALCASAGVQGIDAGVCAQPWYYMGVPIAWGTDFYDLDTVEFSDMGQGDLWSTFQLTSQMASLFNAIAVDIANTTGNYDALQWQNSATPLDTIAEFINASGDGQTGIVAAGDGEVCIAGWGGGGGCAGICHCNCSVEQTNIPIVGCQDQAACNYNPDANIPCTYMYNNTAIGDEGQTFMDFYADSPAGCLQVGDWEDQLYILPAGNLVAIEGDGGDFLGGGGVYRGTNISGTMVGNGTPGTNCCCDYACYGCMEEGYDNYLEPVRDGIPITQPLPPELVCLTGEGCMDPNALNYDPEVEISCNGCCEYNFGLEGCGTFNTYYNNSNLTTYQGGGINYGPNWELIDNGTLEYIASWSTEAACQIMFFGDTSILNFNPYFIDGDFVYPNPEPDWEAGEDWGLYANSWAPPIGSNCVMLPDGTAELQINGYPAVGLDIYNSLGEVQAAEIWNNFCNCCEGQTPQIGCTDPNAENYDENAIKDDGSCEYINGCTDATPGPWPDINGFSSVIQFQNQNGTYYMECEGINNSFWDWQTDYLEENEIPCIVDSYDYDNYFDASLNPNFNPAGPHGYSAVNYNPYATFDDDSCFYDTDTDGTQDEDEVLGCDDGTASNYDPDATQNDGSCVYSCSNVMDSFAAMYIDPFTLFDWGNGPVDVSVWTVQNGVTFCDACSDCSSQTCWDWLDGAGMFGNWNQSSPNFPWSLAGAGNCNNEFQSMGNFPISAVTSCCEGGTGWTIPGCTDETAENYNPEATEDDGSCEYVTGCTDPFAVNYDPEAIIDDGFCEYISYICTPEDSKMGGGCVEVQYPPNSMFPLEMGPEGDTISETPTYATLEECERDCKEKGEKIKCWKCEGGFPVMQQFLSSIEEQEEYSDKGGCPEGWEPAPEPWPYNNTGKNPCRKDPDRERDEDEELEPLDPTGGDDDGVRPDDDDVMVGGPWFCPMDSGNFPWPGGCVQSGIDYTINLDIYHDDYENANGQSIPNWLQTYFTSPVGNTYSSNTSCNASSGCANNMNYQGTGNCAGFPFDGLDPEDIYPDDIEESLIKRFQKLANIKK